MWEWAASIVQQSSAASNEIKMALNLDVQLLVRLCSPRNCRVIYLVNSGIQQVYVCC